MKFLNFKFLCFVLLFLCFFKGLFFTFSEAKTFLEANGHLNETYRLINSAFGGNALEVPDCAHPNDEPHITQQKDAELNRSVFAFHLHLEQDNDRCRKFDRQRVEIKVPLSAPSNLIGYQEDTVTFSWNFRLDSKFQPSSKFTCIHQLKATGGADAALPLISIDLRQNGTFKTLEVIYTGRGGMKRVIKSDDLSLFAGKWIHAKEEVTYSSRVRKYYLELARIHDGQHLMSVNATNMDMWRDGADNVRPKWGIYRSLTGIGALRDEHVYFDNFCLSKGSIDKCT